MDNDSSTVEATLFEDIDVDPETSRGEAADAYEAGLREMLSKGLTRHEHGYGKLVANDKRKSIFSRLPALELENAAVKVTLALHDDARTASKKRVPFVL